MNYAVLSKKVVYENCPIYIRNTGENWEYITVINNEVYTATIYIRKTAIQKILGKPYTPKQTSDITNYLMAMAQSTINTVKNIKTEA